jgi:acetone carboxylase, gamma subunit
VFVRNTPELLQEMYRNWEHSDPQWQEMREFYCPGCYTLLEVEALPPGYPVTFDFLPDLEGFYKEILKKPLG